MMALMKLGSVFPLATRGAAGSAVWASLFPECFDGTPAETGER
jgi:hypothetical protein